MVEIQISEYYFCDFSDSKFFHMFSWISNFGKALDFGKKKNLRPRLTVVRLKCTKDTIIWPLEKMQYHLLRNKAEEKKTENAFIKIHATATSGRERDVHTMPFSSFSLCISKYFSPNLNLLFIASGTTKIPCKSKKGKKDIQK